MNTNTLVGIILGIIAVIVGGYWYFSQGSGGDVNTGNSDTERTSIGQTFAQLMGSGQSLECTYEYNDGTSVSSGTVYMTGGGEKIRGDFNFTQSGAGPMEMHMVRVDGYNYMWGSALPQGIKMQVTEENRAQLFDSTNAQTGAMNDNTQYKCVAWSTDASKFAVPTNVQFMDMGAMQKMMGAPKIGEASIKGSAEGSAGVDVKAIQCAACDQAGDAREQCRAALGCQ